MALDNVASLSYRSDPKGGTVKSRPRDEQVSKLYSSNRLVLLVHGYNNDREDAAKAYKGFFSVQHSMQAYERPIAAGRLFVKVYWPGDAAWGPVSPLFYMHSIEHAKETASNLAALLTELISRHGIIWMDIVAHSMGCRLALELMKHLSDEKRLIFNRVILMAGAVPTFMLEYDQNGGNLHDVFYDALSNGMARSLFSSKDTVLRYAFPLGQTLAGTGEGFFPTALGHECWQPVFMPYNLSQFEVKDAGHGDYWGWNEKTLETAKIANTHIREFLGFESAVWRVQEERSLNSRATPDKRNGIEPRQPIRR